MPYTVWAIMHLAFYTQLHFYLRQCKTLLYCAAYIVMQLEHRYAFMLSSLLMNQYN